MTGEPATLEADVCILGGGPHGLAAAAHLRWVDADCAIAVVDPAGVWLDRWRHQFAAADIGSLRSPIVHHPSPGATALRDHVQAHDLPTTGLPYDPPATASFEDFCDHLVKVAQLDEPIAARAVEVAADERAVEVEVEFESIRGRSEVDPTRRRIRADHLVVACNPHVRVVPEWVRPLLGVTPGVFEHGADVDLRTAAVEGEQVVIVGGGLTAGHLACGAANLGAEVHLVTRRSIRCSSFDTDPGWLGPKFLADYERESDPARRHDQALAARNGGSIPPWMRDRMSDLERNGSLSVHDGVDVKAADIEPDGRCQLALSNHVALRPGRVWMATGTKPDVGKLRCVNKIIADLPVLDGLPVTEADLRLRPYPVYVMGRLAMLALGPAAGNLWGAQRAAERISEAILGVPIEPI